MYTLLAQLFATTISIYILISPNKYLFLTHMGSVSMKMSNIDLAFWT